MNNEWRAIILAGGRGTRLYPYTVSLPKPLVPIGDHPILDVVIGQLKAAGVTRVTLAVNHLAELLMAYFGDGKRFGVAVDYSLEEEPLGTIGPLRLLRDLPENFLVMNGDVLTDLDYRAFWAGHLESQAICTVATHPRNLKLDFGILDVSREGRLVAFREKPVVTQHVSMGIYAFRRDILDLVPPGGPFGFDQLMLALLARDQTVRCHVHGGRWLDIGRPDDYERAQTLFGTPLDARSQADEPTRT